MIPLIFWACFAVLNVDDHIAVIEGSYLTEAECQTERAAVLAHPKPDLLALGDCIRILVTPVLPQA